MTDRPVLHPADVRTGWCPPCRAWTLLTARMLLLGTDGVTDAGARSWCDG